MRFIWRCGLGRVQREKWTNKVRYHEFAEDRSRDQVRKGEKIFRLSPPIANAILCDLKS